MNAYRLSAHDVANTLFKDNLIDIIANQQRPFPLINRCPQRIGLISCQIASQAHGRAPADQLSGQIMSILVEIFGHGTEIVNYTNNIGLLPGGGKERLPNLMAGQ